MIDRDIPPVLGSEPDQPQPINDLPRWRWGAAYLVLIGYVLGIGYVSSRATETITQTDPAATLLPTTVQGLLSLALGELIFFILIFSLALVLGRIPARELLLKWKGGLRPIWRGFWWSFFLRGIIAVLLTVVAVGVAGGSSNPTESMEAIRPKGEVLINTEALRDPLYLALSLTLISFVVAGFREELWRAGVLSTLKGFFPEKFSGRAGQMRGALIAAVVFGLGHLPQGTGGALVTGALGLGFGLMMVRYQSIWEAVWAHGFFNATTFLALRYLADHPELMPK